MQIKINLPPKSCPRPRVSRYGTYYPKPYKDWLKQARALLSGVEPSHIIVLLFVIHRPKRLKGTQRELHTKKPDLDNLQKAVFDALPFDDSIIHTCFSQKVYAAKEEEPHIIMIHGEQYQHCIMKMFKCLSVHMRKSVQ